MLLGEGGNSRQHGSVGTGHVNASTISRLAFPLSTLVRDFPGVRPINPFTTCHLHVAYLQTSFSEKFSSAGVFPTQHNNSYKY